jgi:hypothetical protein
VLAFGLLAGCEAQLSVDLTDAPIDDAAAVVLKVDSVQLLAADGSVLNVDASDAGAGINLLDYQDGGRLQVVSDDGQTEGDYLGIRPLFNLDGAYVLLKDGSQVPLELDSQADYADLDISLSETDATAVVLDIDLRFSLLDRRSTLGIYYLRPVLRAANADDAGSIEGTLADALINDTDCRDGRALGEGVAVYVYAGDDVTPVDYYASDQIVALNQALVSAPAKYDADSDNYVYTVYFLQPGDYTLALTCQADSETPDADDNLVFISSQSVTVSASQETTADFED